MEQCVYHICSAQIIENQILTFGITRENAPEGIVNHLTWIYAESLFCKMK